MYVDYSNTRVYIKYYTVIALLPWHELFLIIDFKYPSAIACYAESLLQTNKQGRKEVR